MQTGADFRQDGLDCAFFAQMEIDGIDPARAWAVRLACDGLWFTELYDSLHLDAALRQRLEAELLRLTE